MKVRKVIQVGLHELRCHSCRALLCQGSSGSVVSIVCGRCGTHMIAELQEAVDRAANLPDIVGMRSPPR